MIKKIVVLPDIHLSEELSRAYQLVKRFIKKEKPDTIILLGDFMDVSALSAWDSDKRRLMEGKRWLRELNIANKELDFLQTHSKEIVYLEGNHEDRVTRYLDRHPIMEGLIEIQPGLRLKERNIKWVGNMVLHKVGKLYMTHGWYTTTYHAKKHLTVIGGNVCYGHTHRAMSDMLNMQLHKPTMAWGLGCLCGKEPEWMRGRPANWINGFAVVYLNDKTGEFNLYPINIISNKFIWNGKEYDGSKLQVINYGEKPT